MCLLLPAVAKAMAGRSCWLLVAGYWFALPPLRLCAV